MPTRYRQCLDCGAQCRGIRCNPCAGKELGARQRGPNHPSWRTDREAMIAAQKAQAAAYSRAYYAEHGDPRGRWRAMIWRCTSPQCPAYKNYGGRGITVCERWLSYDNFVADMGVPPAGLTLDRIDNDGNYEPSNCRWATRKEQSANQRARRRK